MRGDEEPKGDAGSAAVAFEAGLKASVLDRSFQSGGVECAGDSSAVSTLNRHYSGKI